MFDPWVGKIPWRRAWQPTPVFLPGESHGQRSLVGYGSQGCRVWHDWSDFARTHALGPLAYQPETWNKLFTPCLSFLTCKMVMVMMAAPTWNCSWGQICSEEGLAHSGYFSYLYYLAAGRQLLSREALLIINNVSFKNTNRSSCINS